MDSAGRRRAAVFVVPMTIGFVSARRAAPNVRTVDFVILFAAGIVCGVSLMGLIQLFRAPRGGGV